MRFNISWLKDFMICPQYAHNRHEQLRGVDGEATALTVGTLWHLAMANELDPSEEYGFKLLEALDDASDETLRRWKPLKPACDAWQRPPGWTVMCVEHELEVPLDSQHTLVGRLDAIVLWNGKYWHLQHKTLAPGIPVEVFADLMRTDWHECGYQVMAEAAGFQPYGGTILNICRKLSATKLEHGKRIPRPPEEFLSIQYLSREPKIVYAAMDDMREIAYRIIASKAAPDVCPIVRNRSACAGPYRNKICIFKVVCDGVASLSDPRFVDLEERYAQQKVENL